MIAKHALEERLRPLLLAAYPVKTVGNCPASLHHHHGVIECVKLALAVRSAAPGWEAFGNEVGKFSWDHMIR